MHLNGDFFDLKHSTVRKPFSFKPLQILGIKLYLFAVIHVEILV